MSVTVEVSFSPPRFSVPSRLGVLLSTRAWFSVKFIVEVSGEPNE